MDLKSYVDIFLIYCCCTPRFEFSENPFLSDLRSKLGRCQGNKGLVIKVLCALLLQGEKAMNFTFYADLLLICCCTPCIEFIRKSSFLPDLRSKLKRL